MSALPNLERLKKEAKALLKQCRAGDAAAINRVRSLLPTLSKLDNLQLAQEIELADIHHALAREHGFQNWAELKRADAPLEQFLAAIRGGDFGAAKRVLAKVPDLARESIHAACSIGDVDALRYHLDRDPGLLTAEHGGWSSLIYACASRLHQENARFAAGIVDCASLLLDRGADPNTFTLVADQSDPESRITVLTRAHCSFNPKLSELLLQRGALTSERRPGGRGESKALRELMPKVPMDEALTEANRIDRTFNEEIRKLLIPVKDRFFSKSTSSGLPLFLTDPDLRKVAIGLAEFALDRGISPNLAWDSEGNTMLHEFVRLGSSAIVLESVEWLLTHGADPNLPRDDGQSPFVLAVRSGNNAVAEIMRAHGANTNSVRSLDEWIGACRNRDSDAAGDILRRNPKLLATMGPDDHELMVSAAAANRAEEVRFLAQLGFDPGGFGKHGATALHIASWHGQVEMTLLLLELGAPVNIRDLTFGTSPLGWAAHGSRNTHDADDAYCKVVEALLESGADYPCAVNSWGVGPEEISSAPVAAFLRSRGFSNRK